MAQQETPPTFYIQGAHPYETFKALDGTDIEAIYDPAALLQWEYSAGDESVTVSQFQTDMDEEFRTLYSFPKRYR